MSNKGVVCAYCHQVFTPEHGDMVQWSTTISANGDVEPVEMYWCGCKLPEDDPWQFILEGRK